LWTFSIVPAAQLGTVWNRMKPEEENAVLGAALREPNRSAHAGTADE